MRVLFVLSIGHMSGGAATVWFNLMDGLRTRGVEPYVLMPANKDGSMLAALDVRGIPHETEFFTWWTCGDGNPRSLAHRVRRTAAKQVNKRAELKIEEIIRAHKIDLVYIADGTITAGLDAAERCGIPAIWHFHEVIDGAAGSQAFLDSKQQVAQQLARAHTILCVSNYIAQGLKEICPSANVRAVYNGVSANNVAQEPAAINENACITLCGRVDGNKGQLDAVKAFELIAAEFPSVRLRIIGSGAEASMAALRKAVAASTFASRIELRDHADNMADVWTSTAIALNCSYNEGCSLVVMEALCSGCLVIGSSAPGNAELLSDGHGLIYERRNPEQLAEKLRWALRNPDKASQIAAQGSKWAANAFDLGLQLKAVYETFERACE